MSLSAWKTGQNPCKLFAGILCGEQTIGWKDVTFNLMVFVCVALFFLVVILYWLQAVQYCTACTCNIAHISYVHILSAYVVCIFYLLFGVLAP